MRKLILTTALLLTATGAIAQDEYTKGYVKQNGTYVDGYHHTAPNNNPYDNYSTQGNTNPYTGKRGTENPNR